MSVATVGALPIIVVLLNRATPWSANTLSIRWRALRAMPASARSAGASPGGWLRFQDHYRRWSDKYLTILVKYYYYVYRYVQ